MSNETVNGCITHKDMRHMRTYYDYLDIYKQNEHKAKLVRVLETWTDTKRQAWYKQAVELREQGQPVVAPDFWITMSFQQFRHFVRDTIGIDTIKSNLCDLIKLKHVERRVNPDNPYGPPQYRLNCGVIQKSLNTLTPEPFIPDIPELDEYTPPQEVSTPPGKDTPPPGVDYTPTQGGNLPLPQGGKSTPSNNNHYITPKNNEEDTGVSAIATTPPLPLSSSQKIPIATPAPQASENESHSHDSRAGEGVAMAIGNDITKGQTHGTIDYGSRMDTHTDSRLSLRHSQGALGDTRRVASTELSPRDETYHEEHQTPERTTQGVTEGHDDAPATADSDVRLPAGDHHSVSGDHPPDATQEIEGRHHGTLPAPAPARRAPAVVVRPVLFVTPQETAQVTRTRPPAEPKPAPTLDEIAFKKRCDALQAKINEEWRGYALTDKGPMINERMVIKKLVAAYTDTQCAQIWEYLFTRHFKFSKPDYRYTIGAQIMWEQAKNVAQILRGEKANHEAPPTPRLTDLSARMAAQRREFAEG